MSDAEIPSALVAAGLRQQWPTTRAAWLRIALLALAVPALIWLGAERLPSGVDWDATFYPAIRGTLEGRSPYDAPPSLFMAPWALIPILPLAFLPSPVGRTIMLLVGLAAYAYVAHRLSGGRMWSVVVFLLSPLVLDGLYNGNVDYLPILGFVLPPWIGLFLVVLKPHIGLGVAIFWLVEAWRDGGLRQVARVFGPVGLAMGGSLALYGLWPLRFSQLVSVSAAWNSSLWPMSLPVGLALLVAAIRSRKAQPAMAAAPCLAPYLVLHSWVTALVAILDRPYELTAAVIGLWIFGALT